jgi:lysozyme|tara:strand:+ start:44 stop:526 length:483 start_codon:yes stop_codon:yes gene_type:complete
MTVDVKQVYEEISADEGIVLHAYLCSEHHKTVGIGHKVLSTDVENDLHIYGIGADVADDQRISEDRCYELFQGDIQIAINGCIRIYDNWEDLPQEAQHILVNMCFQLGQGGLSKFKNFKAAIEDSQWQRASEEMMDSRWASQTPERAERLESRMLALAGG